MLDSVTSARVIFLHPEAPAKPALGDACNGCGLCCAYAPCPLGMLLSRRRQGACMALEWTDAERRYRCGVLQAVSQRWPRWRWIVQRWIAAGDGCDASLQAAPWR